VRRTRYQFGSVQSKPRKLGPDVWVYRFTDDSGKKRSIEIGDLERYPTKAQALKAAEWLRMNANPDKAVQRGSTFGALLDRYIAEEMSERFSTSDSYGAYIRAYIRPKWQSYALNKIKPFAVEQWLKTLELAPKSRGHIKTIMLNVFNCAMRWELLPIGVNPMKLVRIPDVSKRLTKARVLTAAEVTLLINQIAQEPFRTMAWLSICLGLEPSVLVGLQWGDVDFVTGCLKIQRGVVCNHVDRAKNEYREAPLPLDPSLVTMLERWREKAHWKESTDWIFASPYFDGAKPYSPRHVAEDHLWPAAKAAGLGEKIGWRTFRRTYSSLLRALGVDIKVQQELMRHADIRTTLDGYTDSYSNDMRNAHEKVVKELRIQ